MLSFIKNLFSSNKSSNDAPISQPKVPSFGKQKADELSDVEIQYLAIGFLSQEAELKQDIEVRDLVEILGRGFNNVTDAAKELEKVLPENSLIWTSYEIDILHKQESFHKEELEHIKNMSSNELLQTLKVIELKEIYSRVIGENPKSKLRKNEIISVLESTLLHDEKVIIQNSLIKELPDSKQIEYKQKLKDFVRRYNILRNGILRNQQRLSVASHNEYWLFRTYFPVDIPPECERLNGTIKRWDDNFWQDHPVPCHRHNCSCRIDSYSKRQLDKNGLSVTHS